MKKLIFSVLIFCLLFTIHYSLSFGASLLDRVVATVNNEIITWSDLRRTIEQEGKGLFKESAGNAREIEKTFLNNMIDVRLQLQEARRKGVEVKDSELDEAIANIKKKYNMKQEDFITSLGAEGYTLEEYKEKLREQIMLSKIVMSEVRSNVLVTDREIEDYYEANIEKYNRENAVRIRQIFFNASDEGQKAEAEAKAEKVMKKIKAGEDFARLAEEFSDDASKKFGGDLGYVTKGSILKEIADAAFSLKSGEISRPFRSSRGLHIIKVEQQRGKDEIKEMLFENAVNQKYEEWIKNLRLKAYIEINL
ncbi:MAG: peptidylprolyl isomerase [Nitrospirae bacterium]|nr:peptidylprolyl isomerase [Nitrospirota bacterium]